MRGGEVGGGGGGLYYTPAIPNIRDTLKNKNKNSLPFSQ